MYNNPNETMKMVWVVDPQAIKDNVAFVGATGSTPVSIDTAGGWSRLSVYVRLGATDIAMAALSLTWSDDEAVAFTAVPGSDYATVSDLPSATDDNKTFAWHIPLDGNHKRFFRITATAGDGSTGTFAVALGCLFGADSAPSSAAERGLEEEIFILPGA